MTIKTGVDLVYVPRFQKTLKSGGFNFLQRVYNPEEAKDKRIAHLAGIFAAKEAAIKALGLPASSWHSIKITKSFSGAPRVEILGYSKDIKSSSLSISHDGNYVIACFVVLINEVCLRIKK